MAGARISLRHLLIFYVMEEYMIVANFSGSKKFMVTPFNFEFLCDHAPAKKGKFSSS